jgi:ornithine carbamoyltransferase
VVRDRRENTMMKDLLRTADLAPEDLEYLLAFAEELKLDHRIDHKLLRGETVVLYFATPSTRTRLSFETAVARMGGTPVIVGPAELQTGRNETIADTARVISEYAAAVVIRTPDDDEVRTFAKNASVPVINAMTHGHHPCQSIADLLSVRELYGELAGLKVAYLGDGNNVAHSLLEGAALAGMDVSVATPPGYAPSPDVVERARRLAAASGARVEVTTDPHAAVKAADFVYTDAWISVGDPESERSERQYAFAPYRVTAELFAEASPDARFMHCLPARRADEVATDVIDGPRSIVFRQAENRLPTAQALLHGLVRGRLTGSGC